MPKQEFDKSVRGLYNQYNQVSGVPEGGLLEARNCVVDRPGIVSKRRGFDRYGPAMNGHPSVLFEFKDRLVALDGSTLKCDSDGSGTWSSWNGGFESPDPSHKMRGEETHKNIYFSTANGLYKNDSLTGTPVKAGMSDGLDLKLTPAGTDGWFLANRGVSYRMLWGRKDGNENLIIGAPSYKVTTTNPQHSVTFKNPRDNIVSVTDVAHGYSTGDKADVEAIDDLYDRISVSITAVDADTYTYELLITPDTPLEASTGTVGVSRSEITVEFSVPDGISDSTEDFYEIYRTYAQELSPTLIDTGDRMRRVVKKKVTAAEVAAKKVIFADNVYQADLDVIQLYTNDTYETISQANKQAPYSKDIALFKGYMFACNLRFRQQLELKLDVSLAYDPSTGKPVMKAGDGITVKLGDHSFTYKLASKENIEDREFLLSTEESTNAVNLRETVQSLVRVINRHSTDNKLYAHYSSLELDAPGKILLIARDLSSGEFSVTATSVAFGAMFEEEIATTGSDTKSDPSTMPAGLIHSKSKMPEAYPTVNVLSVGAKSRPIHRIIPLRDSLIILKEDGIFRLSGQSEASFTVRDLDTTVSFEAAETAVALGNSVYCLSNQGVLKIDENGSQVVSWPIESSMKKAENFSNQANVSFAVGYEPERKFILWMPASNGDTFAGKAWVYNYLTKEWTTWMRAGACAIVLKKVNKLYVSDANYKYVLEERKSISGRDDLSDYMDETISVAVESHDTTTDAAGNTVTRVVLTAASAPYDTGWTYWKTVRAGFLFQATTAASSPSTDTVNRRSKVVSATVAARQLTLVMKDNMELAVGTPTDASLTLPIDSYIRWSPEDGGMRTMMKQFTYAMVSMEENKALDHEMGFYNDVVPAREWVNTVELADPVGWGQGKWGEDPWGGNDVRSTPLMSAVPRQHQRCRALTLLYRHRTALEKFDIQAKSLMYRPYGGKIVRQSV